MNTIILNQIYFLLELNYTLNRTMKVKLQIKLEDFKKLIEQLGQIDFDSKKSVLKRIEVKNQMVEKGSYLFDISTDEAWNHEKKCFIKNGKVILKIHNQIAQE